MDRLGVSTKNISFCFSSFLRKTSFVTVSL
uniref:Uncharacterized protein n=1 Tax=Anguilla anguilla TaxID=7936 RepID=A0A0E9TDX6_ANGAN